MKYAVDGEHRDFFQKHRFLELEALLSPAQVAECNRSINAALKSRLVTSQNEHPTIEQQSSEKLFMTGRDLWREDDSLKKLICQRGFAEIAADLISQKPLRLAYDQLIVPADLHPFQTPDNQSYLDLMKKPTTLEAISSIQGITCGLLLSLTEAETTRDPEPFLPSKPGNGVYFDVTTAVDFSKVQRGERFLLIAYAAKSAYYFMQKADPQVYYLKRFGYNFGDKLTIKHLPTVFE